MWMASPVLSAGSLTLLSCVVVILLAMVSKVGFSAAWISLKLNIEKARKRNLRLQVNPQLEKPFVTDRKGHVLIIFMKLRNRSFSLGLRVLT